ncbi:hypothetical protein, partial [uncultured Alistipes sp.]|uniref:hypothetical protein n=1 Tax=uncultured Alistipes sp. TaxID=538949 RepID=UPI00262DB18A
ARTPHFECGPIDHSGISPECPRKLSFWDCKYRHIFCFPLFSGEKISSDPKKRGEEGPIGRF